MKLATIQHDIFWEQPEENFAHLAELISAAADTGARLVMLTEMFSYGFSMNVSQIAEAADGPSTQFLVEQARSHNIWLGGTIPVLADSGPSNSGPSNTGPSNSGRGDSVRADSASLKATPKAKNMFVLAAPDGSTHSYAKIHPFTYGGEDDHYEGGDDLVQVQVEDIWVSLSVCYDLRFPYIFWPLAETTDLYLVPANWPSKRRHHWQSLLVARAIENQAYVAGINRVGTGGDIHYSGDSAIISPTGETLATDTTTAGTTTTDLATPETILTADIDPQVVASVRSRFPFLQDRLQNIS